jgi:xylulokinase
VAWTAAIGAGLASDWSGVGAFVTPGERMAPRSGNAEAYREGYRRYRRLYRPRDRA